MPEVHAKGRFFIGPGIEEKLSVRSQVIAKTQLQQAILHLGPRIANHFGRSYRRGLER